MRHNIRPTKGVALTCCSPKIPVADRPLMPVRQAGELAELFKILASDTRLRLLHALIRAGEMCVNELAEAVGMLPQAVSNQLQRLADRAVVEARREGTSIHYKIIDPCVVGLLDEGLCLLEDGEDRKLRR